MATKQVSVRLSATGGRQVRPELEGVGEAGSRGFGRLSQEMQAANAQLASFARRVQIAATAAATALAGAALSMTRSTVTAANEISQLSQLANATPEVFQRWSAASSTVGVEQEKLADILKDVNDRVGDFLQTGGGPMADFLENIAPRISVTADQFARLSSPEALQLYVSSLEKAGVNSQEMTFYLEAMASDGTLLIPLLQNRGAEMGRLGAQAERLGAVLDSDVIAAMRRSESDSKLSEHYKSLARWRVIRRMRAMVIYASALAMDFSQSFDRWRHRPSQATVRSTTQRRGRTSKPCAVSERLT